MSKSIVKIVRAALPQKFEAKVAQVARRLRIVTKERYQ